MARLDPENFAPSSPVAAPGWDTARAEAAALADGPLGSLMWVDARCVAAGMHALDDWWVNHFGEFYASGKMIDAGRIGLRAAKSVSICRALVNDGLFTERDLDAGTVGVIPIFSTDKTEATDRFVTIRKVLRACGVKPSKAEDNEGEMVPGGIGGEYTSSTLPSGGGVIRTTDSQGHKIEFRIYPAAVRGAVGFTGIGGFADELDLWIDKETGANPAERVIDLLLKRFTTQPTARLYLFSASYNAASAHSRIIDQGDTAIQYVARLGKLGAERDDAARASLAQFIGSTDPRLLAPADPQSVDVPSWCTSPVVPIARCYALSQSKLGPMLGLYGGRPNEAASIVRGPLATVKILRAEPARYLDTVIGIAPGAEWGCVAVSITSLGLVVRADASGATSADETFAAARALGGGSVLVAATAQEPAVSAEIGAYLAGRGIYLLPPLAAQAAYDGPALRLGPLTTLYQRGLLRHAVPLPALEAALRAHHASAERSPRMEALVAAVARLVACYPHVGAPDHDGLPLRRRAAPGSVFLGSDQIDPDD